MSGKHILVVGGLLLLVFGLGLWVGSRLNRPPAAIAPAPAPVVQQSARTPDAPAPAPAPVPSSAPCTDFSNAGVLVGQTGCVAGRVLRAYSSRSGNTFLDFCTDYRACPFTSVVFAADAAKFGNLQILQGKRVELRGDIMNYQGRAEIILHNPQQVRSVP